ncbi:MAG: zinc-finger domain-containing protein [Thiohalocapsa sp.]
MQKISPDPALDTNGVQPPPRSTDIKPVSGNDLPLCCPLPEDQVWNMHPRVYLAIEDDPEGRATCPYCGAKYQLQR